MPRQSSPNTFKRWQLIGIIIAAIASVVTICRFGFPPLIDLAMSERDQEMRELKTEVRELRSLVAQSVEATQKRFEANEKHTGYLREAVAAIRAELRVRFSSSDRVSHNTDHAISNSFSGSHDVLPNLPKIGVYKPSSEPAAGGSADELKRLAARTDQSVADFEKSIPKGKPLEKVRAF
jgi:hypothetical protein